MSMINYFTKDKKKLDGSEHELADGDMLRLSFKTKGVASIDFTQGGESLHSFSGGGSDDTSVDVRLGAGGMGISVRWHPSGANGYNGDADDWHLSFSQEGGEITGGATVDKDGKSTPLDPPVPDGANDAHGDWKAKKSDKKGAGAKAKGKKPADKQKARDRAARAEKAALSQ